MALNKLENQIKEKLSSREIQPSSQAWDRLGAMLTVAEEKKTKRFSFFSFPFIGIAATITILLLAGLVFLSQKSTKIDPQNNIVTTDVKKDSIKKLNNLNLPIQTPIVEKDKEIQVAVSSENKNIKSQNQNNNKSSVSIINQNQSNPLINKDKEIEYLITSDIAVKEIPKINRNTENSKTSNQLDDFLLSTLDNTAKQSTLKKSTVKVDAKSLLSQVDGEIEMTFREKVLTKFSKNYKEVKVALANRNNE